MSSHSTLVRPRPEDASKSAIENVLDLVPLKAIGPDIFTNARPLWRPPNARGIFGGAVIAQCLGAAQLTVPDSFTIHSMHCYFVLAGDSDIPVLYHVEHVREGKSFATRTVQARQRGKPIFTTTMSFVREKSGGARSLEHEIPMPPAPDPHEDPGPPMSLYGRESPFQSHVLDILNDDSSNPHEKRTRQWIKAHGPISATGGHQAHLNALAYMSDSYFLGTIPRVHNLMRLGVPTGSPAKPPSGAEAKTTSEKDDSDASPKPPLQIGMMVSLDHTIYFHRPREFRADEWMFVEMESPWSGDGRGLVFQRIFTRNGSLIATCIQEGLVRLKQDPTLTESKL